MPIALLSIKPGVDVESTKVLSENGWNNSQDIRFRDGLVEKVGGWQHINSNLLIGTGRGMHAWADLVGNPYAAVGTEQRLEIFSGGVFTDITPLRDTNNVTPSFSTTLGSSTVQVQDTANGVSAGDWINIPVPVSVGGLILQGFYLVLTTIDANNYTISTAPKVASSTVANGGAVPAFTTTMGSPNISVLLNNHGLTAASSFQVQVSTTVGGITMAAGSTYPVVSVTSVNRFVIAPGPTAASAATVSENGGNVQIQYLIQSGLSTATLSSGYGVGPYGVGPYGVGASSSRTVPIRQWFLDNWGQDLIGNYNGSPIFVWAPPIAFANVALAINTTNFPGAADPPAAVNVSFVSLPQQQMMAFGASPVGGGNLDPNLVRFSDVADFTDWTPTATNQAGSYRIPSGSRIVGGAAGNNFCVLWTDIDFWLMSYLGFPLVWGFQKIASGCGLLAPRAYGVYKSNIYWVTNSQFMVFDGSTVQILESTVWDQFFYNLNSQQIGKVFGAVNSDFGEISWYYPSEGADECDSYVTFHAYESQRAGTPVWSYGTRNRTCWVDHNVYGNPMGTDTIGNLQQHEIGYDADGVPMLPFITSGYQTISEGTMFTTIRRLIPDMLLTGGTAPNNTIQITLQLLNYPTDATPQTVGPFNWSPQMPEYIMTMCRGRLLSFTISSSALGVFWRIGGFRYDGAPSGRR